MNRDREISRLLRAEQEGDSGVFDRLVEAAYPKLRRLARAQLRRGRRGLTLDTTALVHEAYVRLAADEGIVWRSRGQFYAIAARSMRQIIIEYARRRRAQKRGGGERRVTLDESQIAIDEQAASLILLDNAMQRLAELNDRLVQVVECRFFAGLTEEETSEALDVSRATVQRDWLKARAWLRRELD